MISWSSRSSGTTSLIKRGIAGTTGGGEMKDGFLGLKRNLKNKKKWKNLETGSFAQKVYGQ